MDADFQAKRERERADTAELLREIPGGPELLTFFGGHVSFHDAEVASLTLDRAGGSRLVLNVLYGERWVTVAFALHQWIDVDLKGFSHQNVIYGLMIQRAGGREIHSLERGVGLEPGDFELILEPCFGAYGSIRAGIAKIEFLDGKT